jgi:hypothetical protein
MNAKFMAKIGSILNIKPKKIKPANLIGAGAAIPLSIIALMVKNKLFEKSQEKQQIRQMYS